MELLLYDEEKAVVYPSPEARQIAAFKNIITSDKGSKGDADGRKKLLAIKKLAYVYLIEHPMSVFMDFNPMERHSKICEYLELDINPRDQDIMEAREVYSELVSTATTRTIETIRNGLFSTISLINKTRTLVEVMLDEMDTMNMRDKEERKEILDNMKEINGMLDSMLDKSAKVPKTIEILDEMSEKMKKQMSTKRNIRGQGDINPFEE